MEYLNRIIQRSYLVYEYLQRARGGLFLTAPQRMSRPFAKALIAACNWRSVMSCPGRCIQLFASSSSITERDATCYIGEEKDAAVVKRGAKVSVLVDSNPRRKFELDHLMRTAG